MYKCNVTGRIVPSGTAMERAILAIRPVIYKNFITDGKTTKMIHQTEGWEIVKEVCVAPGAAAKLPTIEELKAKLKGQQPIERTYTLARAPMRKRGEKRPDTRRQSKVFKLRVVRP